MMNSDSSHFEGNEPIHPALRTLRKKETPDDAKKRRVEWGKEFLYCDICVVIVAVAAKVHHVVTNNWDAWKKAYEANVRSIDEHGAVGSFREVFLGEEMPNRTKEWDDALKKAYEENLRSIGEEMPDRTKGKEEETR